MIVKCPKVSEDDCDCKVSPGVCRSRVQSALYGACVCEVKGRDCYHPIVGPGTMAWDSRSWIMIHQGLLTSGIKIGTA